MEELHECPLFHIGTKGDDDDDDDDDDNDDNK
jgi:hypothetical protein